METPIIKEPNPDFPLKNSHSSATFLIHNGFTAPQFQVPGNGIEMIAIPTVSYTSLRDILPDPPPPRAASPATHNASWNEIPIKNPLVKHAALAYLQPMSTRPEVGNKGLLDKLKEKCFCSGGGGGGRGELGCFMWLVSGVLKNVMESFVGLFCERRGITSGEEEEQQVEEEVGGER